MANRQTAAGRAILSLLFYLSLCSVQHSHGFRIYKSRSQAMALLSGVTAESQHFFGGCTQSSNKASCVMAMDDDLSTVWTQCASTDAEPGIFTYWRGYLEVPIYVSSVYIQNADWQRLNGTDAMTEFLISGSGHVCYTHKETKSFSSMTFPCDVLADMIEIKTTAAGAMMSLCEVQVYGSPLKFIGQLEARAPPVKFASCRQSSTDHSRHCWLAIDENLNQKADIGACAMTQVRNFEWWVADFEVPALVQQVRIINREDCCQDKLTNFEITVSGSVCARYLSKDAFSTKVFHCNLFGGDVKIQQMNADPLTLCEVEVYGYRVDMDLQTKRKAVGCFVANYDSPEMVEQGGPVSITNVHPEKCDRMCRRLKKKYFGLHAGSECWCAGDFGTNVASNITECGMECEGQRKEYCGGPGRMLVYELL